MNIQTSTPPFCSGLLIFCVEMASRTSRTKRQQGVSWSKQQLTELKQTHTPGLCCFWTLEKITEMDKMSLCPVSSFCVQRLLSIEHNLCFQMMILLPPPLSYICIRGKLCRYYTLNLFCNPGVDHRENAVTFSVYVIHCT